jgi:hypothetical protein
MSIISANKFKTLDGTTYNVPIQVVYVALGTNLGTTVSSTSDQTNLTPSWALTSTTTTWTDTSNLTLTITPKFSTSLIKLGLSIMLSNTGNLNSAGIRVRRGTTIVFRPGFNSTGPVTTGYSTGGGDQYFHHFLEFYDLPASTSAVTYTLQYRAYTSGTSPIWFAQTAATHYAAANWFTATEIAQ